LFFQKNQNTRKKIKIGRKKQGAEFVKRKIRDQSEIE
jgi:hypothetical protein